MTLAVIGFQQPIPHNFVDSLVQSSDAAIDLRNFTGVVVPSSDSGLAGTCVFVFGAAALGDGGAGLFYWHNTSTAADDGFNVIAPTGLAAGRWIRAQGPVPNNIPPTPATLVTASGAVAVLGAWRTAIWQPTAPAATTMTLPASPADGELHNFKNKLASSAFALTVAANTGQTIDGAAYVVLPNFNDALRLEWWAAGPMWIVL